MRKNPEIYYKDHGVRMLSSLVNPRQDIKDLSRAAILHLYTDDPKGADVDVSNPLLQNYNKKILVGFVDEYIKPEGMFKRPPFYLKELIRGWKKDNLAKFEILEKVWSARASDEQLIVVNYGYLERAYRYQPMILSPYYKWRNRWMTIFATMNEIAKVSKRQQYISIELPSFLYGRNLLEFYQARPLNNAMVNVFGEFGMDGFFQLEMWRWLNPEHRDKSLLSVISPDAFKYINFLMEGKDGKRVLVNLAYLNSWIKGQKNSTPYPSVTQVEATMLQKAWLKSLIELNGAVMDENTEELTQALKAPDSRPELSNSELDDLDRQQVQEIVDETDDQEIHEDDGSAAVHYDGVTNAAPAAAATPQRKLEDVSETAVSEALRKVAIAKQADAEDFFKSLEADLEALDHLNAAQMKDQGIKVTEEVIETPEPKAKVVPSKAEVLAELHQDGSPDQIVLKTMEANAKAGLISAAEYRKMAAIVTEMANKPEPYGSKLTRKEMAAIPKEVLQLNSEEITLPDSKQVADKTMLSRRTRVFDKKYLEDVRKRDVVKMVDGLQNARVIVKAHEVETTNTVLGKYEHHRLEIHPIDGKPSSIRFTFPVPDEDGTFMASGTKYSIRKQLRDLPIRKTAPTIVELSSYYGKTFIQRSDKAVSSSIGWLQRQLNLAIVNGNEYLTNITPGEVYNCENKTPFIYGVVAEQFEKLSAGNNHLYFNYARRKEFIAPELLKKIEKDGRVFCGYVGKTVPIVVDPKGDFIAVTESGEKPLGDIYTLLKLPTDSMPINYTELKVFSKYVPTGVVLAFYIGFTKLLGLTEATYRTVEARKNKNLQPHEYAIVFKDISYVFDRRQEEASMLLAGFMPYEKTTKLYDVEHFDHQAVYLNLLMSKGLSAMYIRELTEMENAFVDPITKDTLVEMKEPTTFKGLLVRANELLMTYDHPVTQDTDAMRLTGYERFAGAMYKEIVKQTRAYRGRNLAGRSKINMGHYDVWNTIMSDPSIKTVEDINPVHNLKESEVVTFLGDGGLSRETMTKPTRAMHRSNAGIISESTVDNTGVGTIAYMTGDPAIVSLRGMMKPSEQPNVTQMVSSAALLSPGALTDNQCLVN